VVLGGGCAIMASELRRAVLIMDYQDMIVKNYSGGDAELTRRAASVLAAARAKGLPVIHVVVRFRPGHVECASRGMFKMVKENNMLLEGTSDAEIHADVAPEDGDVVVTKKRVSAFTGSDLEVVLRGLDVKHLVLFGIATSGVVLSTVRQAADMDFEMTVIKDCCADQDDEVHRVLTDKVFARMATVITAHDFIAE